LYCFTKQRITTLTGDSDADPNYSLSGDSYSENSDKNNYSFDDVNVSEANEQKT